MVGPFVAADAVAGRDGQVVVLDARLYLDGRSAYDEYLRGHVPGAVYFDLERWASGDAGPATGRHPLPSPETFAEGLRRAGVGHATTVVAYDDTGGVMAARVVWMLRVLGHPAALMDGGLQAWPGPVQVGEQATPAEGDVRARPWPAGLFVDADDVAARDRATVVLDARPADRYEGAQTGPDPRAGHIPGARSLPALGHLGDDGRLLPSAALRERLARVGVQADTPVVSSCGSGVTACHTLLVMEHVRRGRGRLYPGSWSQWSRTQRPVATGPDPG